MIFLCIVKKGDTQEAHTQVMHFPWDRFCNRIKQSYTYEQLAVRAFLKAADVND